jgi:hypothetical protein
MTMKEWRTLRKPATTPGPHVDISPDSASPGRGAVQQYEHTLCANTQDSFTIHMLTDVGVSGAFKKWPHGSAHRRQH